MSKFPVLAIQLLRKGRQEFFLHHEMNLWTMTDTVKLKLQDLGQLWTDNLLWQFLECDSSFIFLKSHYIFKASLLSQKGQSFKGISNQGLNAGTL